MNQRSATFLATHPAGRVDPRVLWHSLEGTMPWDDDIESSEDPSSEEGEEEEDDDEGEMEDDDKDDDEDDDEDREDEGDRGPVEIVDVTMFNKAMAFSDGSGSPRSQALLKRYITLKDREAKARRLDLADPLLDDPLVLDVEAPAAAAALVIDAQLQPANIHVDEPASHVAEAPAAAAANADAVLARTLGLGLRPRH